MVRLDDETMNTSELIKMLQDQDPEGTCPVVIGSRPITGAYRNPGYWDGHYTILKDDQYILTRQGKKVVLYVESLQDRIWSGHADTIVLDDSLSPANKKSLRKYISDQKRLYEKFDRESVKEYVEKIKRKLSDGMKVVQGYEYEIGAYNVMWYWKKGSKRTSRYQGRQTVDEFPGQSLSQGECHAVLASGEFDPIKKDKLIFWEYQFSNL